MLQIVPADPLMWIAGAILGIATLLKMMHGRQLQLNSMLREVAQKKLDWAKKKAKAAHMARLAAKRKTEEEAALKQQLVEAGEFDEPEVPADPFAPVLFD